MKTKAFKTKVPVSFKVRIQKWIDGVLCVKAGRGLVSLFIKQVLLISRLSSARVRSLVLFATWCNNLYRKQGRKGLVLSLKAATVLLMQACAMTPIKDAGRLGPRLSRTKGGLPRVIPRLDREKIRSGNTFVIRIWMSLFSLYRLIDFKGTLKLQTITNPPKKFDLTPFIGVSQSFFHAFSLGKSLKLDEP